MSTPTAPSSPTPAGDPQAPKSADANVVSLLSFEDRARIFWEKNSKAIYVFVGLIFAAILVNGVWEHLAEKRERDIAQAYAAATTPAQLKSFIAAHPEHTLAGVAHLRTADEAYAGRRFAEAITPYEQAIAVLPAGPLATRARLGLAMAKLQGGREAEGATALKALAQDANEIAAYRAEAAYHLTSLAASQNNAADVQTFSDLLMQIDPASSWTQRALQLRASSPAAQPAAPAANDGAPAITLPGR